MEEGKWGKHIDATNSRPTCCTYHTCLGQQKKTSHTARVRVHYCTVWEVPAGKATLLHTAKPQTTHTHWWIQPLLSAMESNNSLSLNYHRGFKSDWPIIILKIINQITVKHLFEQWISDCKIWYTTSIQQKCKQQGLMDRMGTAANSYIVPPVQRGAGCFSVFLSQAWVAPTWNLREGGKTTTKPIRGK